jgi:hypothetical protein
VPDEAHLEAGDWLREVGVAALPVPDPLRILGAEALGDLGDADEVIHVDAPPHAATVRRHLARTGGVLAWSPMRPYGEAIAWDPMHGGTQEDE